VHYIAYKCTVTIYNSVMLWYILVHYVAYKCTVTVYISVM